MKFTWREKLLQAVLSQINDQLLQDTGPQGKGAGLMNFHWDLKIYTANLRLEKIRNREKSKWKDSPSPPGYLYPAWWIACCAGVYFFNFLNLKEVQCLGRVHEHNRCHSICPIQPDEEAHLVTPTNGSSCKLW